MYPGSRNTPRGSENWRWWRSPARPKARRRRGADRRKEVKGRGGSKDGVTHTTSQVWHRAHGITRTALLARCHKHDVTSRASRARHRAHGVLHAVSHAQSQIRHHAYGIARTVSQAQSQARHCAQGVLHAASQAQCHKYGIAITAHGVLHAASQATAQATALSQATALCAWCHQHDVTGTASCTRRSACGVTSSVTNTASQALHRAHGVLHAASQARR